MPDKKTKVVDSSPESDRCPVCQSTLVERRLANNHFKTRFVCTNEACSFAEFRPTAMGQKWFNHARGVRN